MTFDKSPSRKQAGNSVPAFAFGDAVTKIGGDYTFDGEVRAVVVKLSGQVRYVVEDDRGQLHIYREDQLGPRGSTETSEATHG